MIRKIKINKSFFFNVYDNNKGDSTEFIEFMLKMIDETLDEALSAPSIPVGE